MRAAFFLVALGLMAAAASAQALVVDNCSDKPQTVTVYYPGERVEVMLEPGQSRRLFGFPLQLGYRDQVIEAIRYDDEWCVWDGRLRIQKRNTHRRS